jgi:hypothetical protein
MKRRFLIFQFLWFFLLFFWVGSDSIVVAEEANILVSFDCANIVDNDARVYLAQNLIHTFTFPYGETECSGYFTTEDMIEGINPFTFGTGDIATDAHTIPYYINFSLKNPTSPIIISEVLSWTAGTGAVSGYTVFYDTIIDGQSNEFSVPEGIELDLSSLGLTDGIYYFIISPYDSNGYYGKSMRFKLTISNSGNIWTISNITYVITISCGAGGSTLPVGPITADEYSDQIITINPVNNYHISSILDNGEFSGTSSPYSILNISGNHALTLTFAPDFAAPTNFTMAASSPTSVSFSWTDNSVTETGFSLVMANDSAYSVGVRTITLPANTISYSATVAEGSKWYSKIQATGIINSSWLGSTPLAVRMPLQ